MSADDPFLPHGQQNAARPEGDEPHKAQVHEETQTSLLDDDNDESWFIPSYISPWQSRPLRGIRAAATSFSRDERFSLAMSSEPLGMEVGLP